VGRLDEDAQVAPEPVRLERLGQIELRPQAVGPLLILDRAFGRKHDDRQAGRQRWPRLELGQDGESVDLGHEQVQKHDVGLGHLEVIEEALRVLQGAEVELPGQGFTDQLDRVRAVIDEKDAPLRHEGNPLTTLGSCRRSRFSRRAGGSERRRTLEERRAVAPTFKRTGRFAGMKANVRGSAKFHGRRSDLRSV